MKSSEWIDKLRWRYAVKQFDPARKISESDWQAIEQSLVLTPSSFGLQPWKFVVVTSPEVKKQLPAISWGQAQPHECSHLVVLTARREMTADNVHEFVDHAIKVRNVPPESLLGYRKMMVGFVENTKGNHLAWSSNQVYIALGQLMATAALLGIDACPMEGVDTAKYDEVLGLSSTPFTTRVCCALGYRHADDKYASLAKVRFDTPTVVEYR